VRMLWPGGRRPPEAHCPYVRIALTADAIARHPVRMSR
jgi:hypothetical protein